MRTWILFALLCLVFSSALAVDLATDVKTVNWDFQIRRGGGTYVNGDSGDVVIIYPADEDSAGKGRNATWLGSNSWRYAVTSADSFEVVDVYYRSSCCACTLASIGMNNRMLPLTRAPEGFVTSPRAFAAGVVDSAALDPGVAAANLIASRSDSGVMLVDSLNVTSLRALQSAVFLPGASEVRIDDQGVTMNNAADLRLRNGASYDQTSGTFFTTAPIEAGFAASDVHDFTGIVSATNDVTSGDDVTVGDDLTVTDNATLGNADTDQVTIAGDLNTQDDTALGNDAGDDVTIAGSVSVAVTSTLGNDTSDQVNVAGDLNVTDVSNLNGAMNLGNATSDALTITADLTAEGDFDIEDSLAVATDFGAADSTKSAIRINRWFLELSADAVKTFTMNAGTSSQNYKWPGAKTNDCPICTPTNASTSSGLSSNYTIYISGNGVASVARSGSTNNLVIRCVLFKQ